MNFDSGCKFINQGKAYIGKTDSNITIDNGCYLYAEEFVGTLNMGDTSSAEIEDFGDHSNNYNTQITMGDNSMITVLDEAELSQAQFMGPNNEYALVKINKIEDIGNFSSQGNIHYEVKEIDDDITEDIWWEAKFLDAIKNTEGTISKWGRIPHHHSCRRLYGRRQYSGRVRLRNPYRPGLLYVRIRRQLPVGRRL